MAFVGAKDWAVFDFCAYPRNLLGIKENCIKNFFLTFALLLKYLFVMVSFHISKLERIKP